MCGKSALILLMAILGLCHAQLTLPIRCPIRIPMQNFDINRYVGEWFELQRYSGQYRQEGDCVTNSLTSNQVTSQIDVANALKMLTTGLRINITGEARLSNPTANMGALRVNLQGMEEFDYWVLATDYINYSIVWSCLDVGTTGTSQVSAWVLSRARTLDPTQLQTVNQLIDQNFDRTLLRNTEQDVLLCSSSAAFIPTVLLVVSAFLLSLKF